MQTHQFYATLHVGPTVVYAKAPWLPYFAPQFDTPEPVAILAATNWRLTPVMRETARRWARSHLDAHPNHHIEFLLDRDDEVEFFSDAGFNVTSFNPNALCDERVFRPLPRRKLFDAVYIARPAQHKRLHLCREIGLTAGRKWQWITYEADKNPTIVRDVLAMPNVDAPQWQDGKFTGFIPRQDIPGMLCRSVCGLALSDEEGSNYSSAEYLLCGIPVVYTPGETTRTQLFPSGYTIKTDADPYKVAEAVLDSREAANNPERCREETLALMLPHRHRFVRALRLAYRAVGIPHDPTFDLFHLWRHQLLFWQSVDKVLVGGDRENRELLDVAKQEPRVRRLWGSSERFWERTARGASA